MSALAGIAAAPPSLSREAVADAVTRQFGRHGEMHPLVSERDQNFCLAAIDGCRYLVKVTGKSELAATTERQVRTLQHLEGFAEVIAPRVVPTLRGEACGRIEAEGSSYSLRLLSWVEGELLETLDIDTALATRFGRALGALDNALAGVVFDGENPVLLWDLQRVGELRSVLECVDNVSMRARIATVIEDYEANVVPLKHRLAHQVIHSDANPENVVVDEGAIGFIDFGDIVHAPRVYDIAIAASYLRREGNDPLELIRPFIGGYHAAAPLAPAETEVLFDLVRARLATSIGLLYWRLQDRPESDEYRRKSLETESNASQFLVALDSTGREKFNNEINEIL